jgi:hypothetical protein
MFAAASRSRLPSSRFRFRSQAKAPMMMRAKMMAMIEMPTLNPMVWVMLGACKSGTSVPLEDGAGLLELASVPLGPGLPDSVDSADCVLVESLDRVESCVDVALVVDIVKVELASAFDVATAPERSIVLVYRRPLTPIIVCASPVDTEKVPFPKTQSQSPLVKSGWQQNLPFPQD